MSLKITEWAVEDRPRERLWNTGPSSLSDAELIAILIGTGTKNASAVDIARELLAMAGTASLIWVGSVWLRSENLRALVKQKQLLSLLH
jgi:DNA repair protein RadC